MINYEHTRPFLPDGLDLHVRKQAESLLIYRGGHEHLHPITQHLRGLLEFHTYLHVMGMEETMGHDRCMDMLQEVDETLQRGLDAMWS